jgi:YgiT-type zinc finger domain-containing protein
MRGAVQEHRVSREVWWHGHRHPIEDVPVGVCGQCGEKFIRPEVAKTIDRMLAGEVRPDHFIGVPAYRWQVEEPVLWASRWSRPTPRSVDLL